MAEVKIEIKHNPSDLDGLNSKYDYDLHLPIPTVDFIKQETGEDLILLAGNETKAKAFLRQIANFTMSFVKRDRSKETAYKLEYLIAKNKEYRHAFIMFVSNIVFEIINSQAMETYLTSGKNIDDMFTGLTKTQYEGSILNVYYFTEYLDSNVIRVGY